MSLKPSKAFVGRISLEVDLHVHRHKIQRGCASSFSMSVIYVVCLLVVCILSGYRRFDNPEKSQKPNHKVNLGACVKNRIL